MEQNILISELAITYDMQTTERIVTLSPLAIARVKEFIAKDNNQANGVRIFVQPGGCSGYQYGMVLENNAKSDDLSWTEDGINIYVDNQSAQFVRGANIDFVETVQGSGFKIDNPNAVSSCGCGNSFETEESQAHSHSHDDADGGCGCGGGACGCG